MSTSPPLKLNPLSKRLLLEFGLNSVLKPSDNNRIQRPSSAFKFMLISKSFLNCSSSKHFKPSYRLTLTYPKENTEKISVNLTFNDYFYSAVRLMKDLAFKVTYREMFQILRLLQPPFIGIRAVKSVSNEEFCEFQDFLRMTNSKIGLYLNQDGQRGTAANEHRYYKFIKRFAPRISELDCEMELLDEEDENSTFPRLNLEHLEANHISDQDQILRVLRHHKVKSLDLYLEYDHYNEELREEQDEEKELNFVNNELEHIQMRGFAIGYPRLNKLARMLAKHCPKVKKMEILTSLHFHIGDIRVSEISPKVLEFYEIMKTLQTDLAATNPLLKFTIDFSLIFMFLYDDAEYTHNWLRQIFTNSAFKDWNKHCNYGYNPFQKANIYSIMMGNLVDGNIYRISASAYCSGPKVDPSIYDGSDLLFALKLGDDEDDE